MEERQQTIAQWTEELIAENRLLLGKIQSNTALKTPETAKEGLNETLRFLYLCSLSSTSLTPSKLVDDLWHEFILFTRSYHAFCHDKFGQFVHHQPDDQPSNVINQYKKTLEFYGKHFEQPNHHYWPTPDDDIAQCGPCET